MGCKLWSSNPQVEGCDVACLYGPVQNPTPSRGGPSLGLGRFKPFSCSRLALFRSVPAYIELSGEIAICWELSYRLVPACATQFGSKMAASRSVNVEVSTGLVESFLRARVGRSGGDGSRADPVRGRTGKHHRPGPCCSDGSPSTARIRCAGNAPVWPLIARAQ